MIQIPKLDNLEELEDKRIVLFGAGVLGKSIHNILQYLGYNVIAFCVDIEGELETEVQGIPVISLEELKGLSIQSDILILLCVFVDTEARKKLIGCLGTERRKISSMSAGMIQNAFFAPLLFEKIRQERSLPMSSTGYYNDLILRTRLNLQKFLMHKHSNPFLLCLPPKTGDNTLMFTFDDLNIRGNDVLQYENLWHKPHLFQESTTGMSLKPIKLITALREPIAQNLSMLYESICAASEKYIMRVLLELENTSESMQEIAITELEDVYVKKSNDAQVLFDDCINKEVYPPIDKPREPLRTLFIQPFIHLFCEDILNIYQHPFDKEKGYAIMKQGNVEVFIYQLEKMNDIVPELSEWVGVPFDSLVRGNDASGKWIADSYKQAQKEIEITQEYFDRCFNEPYVKHCYSKADIEIFEARWRPHIKK